MILGRFVALLAFAQSQDGTALIEKLGDARPDVREQASRRLLEIGEAALPELRIAGASNDPEVSHRAHMILEEIALRKAVFQDDCRGRWEGFAEGSWVVLKTTRIGQEEKGPLFIDKKIVLEIKKDGTAPLRGYWKRNDADPYQEEGAEREVVLEGLSAGLTEVSRRREGLDIGGRSLKCSVL